MPQQFLDCAIQMPEADRYTATRSGPGTIRDPLHDAADADDASDELGEESEKEDCANNGDEQSVGARAEQHVNHFETPLGVDHTVAPDFVQHIAAFKVQLDLVQQALRDQRANHPNGSDGAAQPADVDMTAATAQAAAEEHCYRAVVDLREAAQKLDKRKFEKKARLLDAVEHSALFVPTNKPLSMFDGATWSKCCSEWWYGDALPNMHEQQPKLSYEELFGCLIDREELEYQLQTDSNTYLARCSSRFDTPEMTIVMGGTLKRLLEFKGTRLALKRKGFQKDVKLIANATSEQCMAALNAHSGQLADLSNANTEALARNQLLSKELAAALRQVLVSTKDVPLTDGYKRNLRHEGRNLNVTENSLVVFATINFADTYSPVLCRLLREDGAGQQSQVGEDITCDLTKEAPDMLSLQSMHQLISQSPRAQANILY